MLKKDVYDKIEKVRQFSLLSLLSTTLAIFPLTKVLNRIYFKTPKLNKPYFNKYSFNIIQINK